jgi:hypothetical protein
MRRLLDLGVNGILTDFPDRLRSLLDRQAPVRILKTSLKGVFP